MNSINTNFSLTEINKTSTDEDTTSKRSNFLFYGLLIYTAMFYSQIAGRFPVLAPFRLELVVGSILVFFSFSKILKGEIPFNENRLNLAVIFFFLAAFITIPFALVKTRALDQFIRLFKFFAIYLMIITTVNNENKLKGFLYVYMGMITLLFIEPFFLSLKGEGFIYNNGMLRLAGATHYFGHPNQLGGITSANLPFFYYLMKYEKSKTSKLICFILILISLSVIMLTQSRTAFLGVITFGIVIWLFSKKKLLSLIVIVLSCILLWQVAPQQTKDRFFSLGDAPEILSGEMVHEQGGSMYSRWVLIKRGFIAFKENPILGLGLECFISFNGRRWGHWFPPHNTYIQALAEMGIIGFSAFLYVIIITLKNLKYSNRIMREIKEEHSFIAYLSTAVTAYLIVRLMVSMFGQDLYANYWWVAGGLSLVLSRIAKLRYQEYKAEQAQNASAKQVD